jgi:hypothetical protein
MKTFILVLFFSTMVSASEHCKLVEENASAIMSLRQNGVPASTLMEMADKQDPEAIPLIKELIRTAFDFPIFVARTNKDRATQEFANVWFLQCSKGEK